MNTRKFSFLVILGSLLQTVYNHESSLIDYEKFPFCMFANSKNCSLKAQTKVNIEWGKMNGTWYEVFRVRKKNHGGTLYDEDWYARTKRDDILIGNGGDASGIYKKGNKKRLKETKGIFHDELAEKWQFFDHKMYNTDDKTHSWMKTYYTKFPVKTSRFTKMLLSPILKRVGQSYVVLNMDPNYDWCLAGEPCRSSAWLLLREGSEKLDRSVIDDNIQVLKEKGYNFDELEIQYVTQPEGMY